MVSAQREMFRISHLKWLQGVVAGAGSAPVMSGLFVHPTRTRPHRAGTTSAAQFDCRDEIARATGNSQAGEPFGWLRSRGATMKFLLSGVPFPSLRALHCSPSQMLACSRPGVVHRAAACAAPRIAPFGYN